MRKHLVLLSGGADSATCLAKAVATGEHVEAVAISYGQRHVREIEAAAELAQHYNVPLHCVDLAATELYEASTSTLLNGEPVPEGTYNEQRTQTGVISTEVPFRNGLFAAAATAKALTLDPSATWTVWLGVHRDDTAAEAYPDCSHGFTHAMTQAIMQGTGGRATLATPFVNSTKTQVIAEGIRLHVPYEHTWSCYAGHDEPCGACATCIDRATAFANNNTPDPLVR